MWLQGECSICSDIFSSQLDISATPCGHVFHASCLNTWFNSCRPRSSGTCPQCRHTFPVSSVVAKLFVCADSNTPSSDAYSAGLVREIATKDLLINKLKSDKSTLTEVIIGLKNMHKQTELKLKKVITQCDIFKEKNLHLKRTIDEHLRKISELDQFKEKVIKKSYHLEDPEAIESESLQSQSSKNYPTPSLFFPPSILKSKFQSWMKNTPLMLLLHQFKGGNRYQPLNKHQHYNTPLQHKSTDKNLVYLENYDCLLFSSYAYLSLGLYFLFFLSLLFATLKNHLDSARFKSCDFDTEIYLSEDSVDTHSSDEFSYFTITLI